jgi:hypothetical protein
LDPKFTGSDPAKDDEFLMGIKNPYYDFLWRGSKAIVPMS